MIIVGDIVCVGTPEDVIEWIEETCAVCERLTEVAITVNPGWLEHWKAIRKRQLFADVVIRHFQPSATRSAETAGAIG